MSADIFTNLNSQSSGSMSKIPVPSSPTPFRRQSSLRLKKDAPSTDRAFTRGRSFIDLTHRDGNRCQKDGASSDLRKLGLQQQFYKGSKTEATTSNTVTGKGLQKGLKVPAATPQTSQNARIRSLSLSLSNAKNCPSPSIATSSPVNPAQIDRNSYSLTTLDWDSESLASLNSSVASNCDHACVARNGTTFSGRTMKYVYHCNQHAGATGEEYLTPTQRAHRQVKKLKCLLQQAKKDLEQKDSEILKLTKEIVELRLYKVALNSPEDKSSSSDGITVKENVPEAGNIGNHIQKLVEGSLGDSGHFEDSSYSSPSKSVKSTSEVGIEANLATSLEQSELILEYERRLQELIKTHEEEAFQMRQKHNDKIEELLQRISEINSRYWQLVPELEAAKDRIKELEAHLEEASTKLQEQEINQRDNYLKMYNQGHQAAKMEEEVAVELANKNPSRISVPELLQELQVTKNELEKIKAMYRQLMEAKSKNKIDPEITLQFLKSAIYYFLTDKENSQGHLKAIQSILGFSQSEIDNIDKARLS